jgi:hypothetical protein
MSIQLDGSSGVVTPGLEVTNEYVVSNTFVVGANNTLYVDPVSGNVGIGTSLPDESAILNIRGREYVGNYGQFYDQSLVLSAPADEYPGMIVKGYGGPSTGGTADGEFGEMGVIRLRGTPESPLPTQNGDTLGIIYIRGTSTSNVFRGGGYIAVQQTGDSQSQSVPGAMLFFTADNTTLFGTERMRITSDGNVGIGTSSPDQKLDVNGAIVVRGTVELKSGNNTYYQNSDNTNAYFILNNGDTGSANATLAFVQNAVSERMRIDSNGNVGIGTSSPGAKLDVKASSGSYMTSFVRTGSGAKNGVVIFSDETSDKSNPSFGILTAGTSGVTPPESGYRFASWYINGGATVGTITYNGSGTSYNTSSDYRLKENVQPMQNALQTVSLLKPCKYIWKADGSAGEGFIAHELQEVCPQAVTGEKDEVDSNGKPVYQGVDTSFLVATLTAAIQELKAEVDLLKSQIN